MRRISIGSFQVERFCVPVRLDPRAQRPKKPRNHMRLRRVACAVALVPLLASCASAPLTLAPVGPGPYARTITERGIGELQVYSEPEEYYEEELSYFPHTDYQLFTVDGKHLRRVWNHNTHEDETPPVVSRAAGEYVVQAWAEFHGLVRVPVVIKPNELTKVILQPGWNPGKNATPSKLVQIPQDYFVGWRAD
jgi:hypothetical protein